MYGNKMIWDWWIDCFLDRKHLCFAKIQLLLTLMNLSEGLMKMRLVECRKNEELLLFEIVQFMSSVFGSSSVFSEE